MALVMMGAADSSLARMAQGAVDVDFDLSVLGQVVLFLILMLVLKPVLFEPMLKLFEEREKRIDGVKSDARKTDAESAEAETKYHTELHRVREAANGERDKLRSEAVRTENEILARVRESTTKTLEEGRQKAAGEAAQARTALREQSRVLARDIASRVLGREVEG